MGSDEAMTPPPPAAVLKSGVAAIRVFVDFWNLQLTLNEREQAHGGPTGLAQIDWLKFPQAVISDAKTLLSAECSYEGTHVYTFYDPKTDSGKKFKHWATTWLDRQRGMQVNCYPRQPKHPPKCNNCHKPIQTCPMCSLGLAGTIEKGVDTAIVTDMIRLAWEGAYNVAIVVSSDQDLVPAVQFLDMKGFKVIQAGFPPLGMNLSTTCWASIDLFKIRDRFLRNANPSAPSR